MKIVRFKHIHPLNLSLLRIAFVGLVIALLNQDWFYGHMQNSGQTVHFAILYVFSIFVLFGFYARFSAIIMLLTGILAVNTLSAIDSLTIAYMALLILGILAISPSADMLAIDSLITAKSMADKGFVEAPKPNVRCGLAVNMIRALLIMSLFFIQNSYLWVVGLLILSCIDWNTIFITIGRLLFSEKLIVLFDGNCGICRRTMAMILRFDVFGRIEYRNANDKKALEDQKGVHVTQADLMKDIHMICEGQWFKGFYGYRKLTYRIPVMWPVIPFLYLKPVISIGNNIYRKIADQRSCQVVYPQGAKND